jgi:hypothetical protein
MKFSFNPKMSFGIFCLICLIVYTVYDSNVYNKEMLNIEKRPSFVSGKISEISHHSHSVVVSFEYVYSGQKYSNKETLVQREYEILNKLTNKIIVVLDKKKPKISRILYTKESFSKYQIPDSLKHLIF